MADDGEIKTTFETSSVNYTAASIDVDFITFTNLRDKVTIHIDTTNLVDPTTIKVKETVNGVTDLTVSTKIFPADYDTGVTSIVFVLDGAGEDMRVTLNSITATVVSIGTNTRSTIRL